MDAITFLNEKGRDAADQVAKRAGTNMVYFSQIAYGHRKPSPKLARRLVEASSGELTLQELRPDIYGTTEARA